MAFRDDDLLHLVGLLEVLRPRPTIYLCGHMHDWEGYPREAFDTEVVADVPIYCQGRTGGLGADPSWTLHELSALEDGGAIDSRLQPL